MAFDIRAFERAQFEPRTFRVKVPTLKDFFAEGEEPVFIVRNLTHSEAAKCADVESHNDGVSKLLDAAIDDEQTREELKDRAGVYHKADTHKETAIGCAMLVAGSVEPKIDFRTALKLSEHHNFTFQVLIDTIGKLSTLGSELAKPAPSGKTQPSEP